MKLFRCLTISRLRTRLDAIPGFVIRKVSGNVEGKGFVRLFYYLNDLKSALMFCERIVDPKNKLGGAKLLVHNVSSKVGVCYPQKRKCLPRLGASRNIHRILRVFPHLTDERERPQSYLQ
jgi:hypothetical protein